jgi:hypothetical protein
VQSPGGRVLVPAGSRRPDLVVPNSDYVLTLDADSILLPEYCLRLVYFMEQAENGDVAVVQTPYSAYRGAATRIERIAGATTDIQHIVHQGLTHYDATFWVGANAVIRKRALDELLEEEDEAVVVVVDSETEEAVEEVVSEVEAAVEDLTIEEEDEADLTVAEVVDSVAVVVAAAVVTTMTDSLDHRTIPTIHSITRRQQTMTTTIGTMTIEHLNRRRPAFFPRTQRVGEQQFADLRPVFAPPALQCGEQRRIVRFGQDLAEEIERLAARQRHRPGRRVVATQGGAEVVGEKELLQRAVREAEAAALGVVDPRQEGRRAQILFQLLAVQVLVARAQPRLAGEPGVEPVFEFARRQCALAAQPEMGGEMRRQLHLVLGLDVVLAGVAFEPADPHPPQQQHRAENR